MPAGTPGVGGRVDRAKGKVGTWGSVSDGAGSPLSPPHPFKDQTATPLPRGAAGEGRERRFRACRAPGRLSSVFGPNDDVVVRASARGYLHPFWISLVMLRWASDGRGVAHGWVVDQELRALAFQHQRPLDHLPRIRLGHDRPVARREEFIGDDAVLAVEVEDVEAFRSGRGRFSAQ